MTRRLIETASQTAGPYVHIGVDPEVAGFDGYAPLGRVIAGHDVSGERIRVGGHIFDGSGAPVTDAVIEIWQADAAGRFAGQGAAPGFRGWGRVACDFGTGAWEVETIRPGPVTEPDGRVSAPQLSLWIVARGINLGLHSRVYFPEEGEANAADPVLALAGDRAATLIAAAGDAPGRYRFDIRLQGEGETVFLDV